jgi:hypothetical protein
VSDLGRIFAHVSDTFAAGGGVLLLTDYDGTLTPIVGDPADAWLPREVRDDLRLLARSARIRVGVLSGRDHGDSKCGGFKMASGVLRAGDHHLPGQRPVHGTAVGDLPEARLLLSGQVSAEEQLELNGLGLSTDGIGLLVVEPGLDAVHRPSLSPRVQQGRDRGSGAERGQEQLVGRGPGVLAAGLDRFVDDQDVPSDPHLVSEIIEELDCHRSRHLGFPPGL